MKFDWIVGGMPMMLIISVLGVITFFTFSVFSLQPTVPTRYVCPPKFNVIGKRCYYFSKEEVTWQDAHFKCEELNSTFATVTGPYQELVIRKFLNTNSAVLGKYERWIDGRYNWMKSRWEWGISGKPLVFQGFSRMNAQLKNKWKWHCIIIDPSHHNKWGARSCWNKKRFVCQTPIDKFAFRERNERAFGKKMCKNYAKISSNERRLCDKMKIAPVFLVEKPMKSNKYYIYNNLICPPHMILVGRKCYFFSTEALNWHEASWACRDNRTKLAIINNKLQNNILKGFLNGRFVDTQERWIGGFYDWAQNQWKWAINGNILKYTDFAQRSSNKEYVCASMDPRFQYQWTSKSCFERKNYICQVKPKTVAKFNEKQIREPQATVLIQLDNETDNRINPFYNQPTEASYLKNY